MAQAERKTESAANPRSRSRRYSSASQRPVISRQLRSRSQTQYPPSRSESIVDPMGVSTTRPIRFIAITRRRHVHNPTAGDPSDVRPITDEQREITFAGTHDSVQPNKPINTLVTATIRAIVARAAPTSTTPATIPMRATVAGNSR